MGKNNRSGIRRVPVIISGNRVQNALWTGTGAVLRVFYRTRHAIWRNSKTNVLIGKKQERSIYIQVQVC
jgi:hypothetical protein